ncbi:MAG: HDOD domain-containing protein [Campylobacterales bacterium]|nr:HDOD domain-containing protein [Campylobacterales bacterium]
MTDAMLKQIKQLPPLPETAIQIEAVYQNVNATFEDMVKILQKDPLLTADILKSANSPLYGFSREITSISQAVSLFGMGTIRGFALASIISKSFPLDLSPYGISPAQYSNKAKLQNALVTGWYVRKNPKILGVLSAAAFLVDIGKVLIAQVLKEERHIDAFAQALKAGGNISETEQTFVGATTAQTSAQIFDHWRFEEEMILSIRHCEAPLGAPDGVRLAAQSLQIVRTAVTFEGTLIPQSVDAAKALVHQYALDIVSFEGALANLQA